MSETAATFTSAHGGQSFSSGAEGGDGESEAGHGGGNGGFGGGGGGGGGGGSFNAGTNFAIVPLDMHDRTIRDGLVTITGPIGP